MGHDTATLPWQLAISDLRLPTFDAGWGCKGRDTHSDFGIATVVMSRPKDWRFSSLVASRSFSNMLKNWRLFPHRF